MVSSVASARVVYKLKTAYLARSPHCICFDSFFFLLEKNLLWIRSKLALKLEIIFPKKRRNTEKKRATQKRIIILISFCVVPFGWVFGLRFVERKKKYRNVLDSLRHAFRTDEELLSIYMHHNNLSDIYFDSCHSYKFGHILMSTSKWNWLWMAKTLSYVYWRTRDWWKTRSWKRYELHLYSEWQTPCKMNSSLRKINNNITNEMSCCRRCF